MDRCSDKPEGKLHSLAHAAARRPTQTSWGLLQRHTTMPVHQVYKTVVVRPDTAHVIPLRHALHGVRTPPACETDDRLRGLRTVVVGLATCH